MKTLKDKEKQTLKKFNELNRNLKLEISNIYLEIIKNEFETLYNHFKKLDKILFEIKINDKNIKEKLSFDLIISIFKSILINHKYINKYDFNERINFISDNIAKIKKK